MDLKPENFMFTEQGSKSLKMIDFGLSQNFKNKPYLTKISGTLYYISPEVLQEEYSEKCDLWSIGVMLFIMITEELPFNTEDEDELM